MYKLFTIFVISVFLAYVSERKTQAIKKRGQRYTVWRDGAYILLVALLVLFAGLRTKYNDTWNYATFFKNAPTVMEFIENPKNWNPFINPLFYFYQSIIKTVVNDAQMLIFTSAAFSQICFILFFKRYANSFTFSIFLYFTLGTFVFTLAAIKQVLAMALLTLAFPYLEKKKWVSYYLIVIAAMLIHTYAIAFAMLPFFTRRPWRAFTFMFITVIAIILMNFESTITTFMEQANDLGKTIAEYEIFDDATINVFRLAVYAVPPVISFVFQRWVLRDNTHMDNVLMHMSIIGLAFMSMGTQSGANMFGRMGNYFELGTICCLPVMLKKTFASSSYRIIAGIACICFLGFFFYANMINIDFGQEYNAISLWEFLF